jgi:hypothetical protein
MSDALLEGESKALVARAITLAREQPDFGNAGDIETLGRRITDARDLRVFEKHGLANGHQNITVEDIESGLAAWLDRRRL